VISAIRRIPLSLDLTRRDAQPSLVCGSQDVPVSPDNASLNRLTVFFIAARKVAIVRSHPMLIKLVMDLRVFRRVIVSVVRRYVR
jgi:hypothetical protein